MLGARGAKAQSASHVSQMRWSTCSFRVDRYYRALSSIETRFPISKDAGHVHVSFIWFDAFRPSKRAEQVTVALQHETPPTWNNTVCLWYSWRTLHGNLGAAKRMQRSAGQHPL
jgi:hypothetical protein